jgi:hypothetical protein
MTKANLLSEKDREYKWEFQLLEGNRGIADDESILEEFRQVCVDGFGIESGSWIDDNRSMLLNSTLLGMLINSEGKIYGIVYYSAPQELLDGTYLLWEDGICLRKEVQGKSYSRAAVEGTVKLFQRSFKWLGCRTQNPNMFARYKKLGKVFPFDESYDTLIGACVMNFLISNIVEVREVNASNKLNKVNGVCVQTYPQGRLGDYQTGIEGTAEFEKKLEKWGFQREQGDAVVIVTLLFEPF